MSDELEKSKGDVFDPQSSGSAGGGPEGDNQEPDGPSEERPTVSPPFDPAAFARDVLSKPSPAAGTPVVHHDAHTHATPPHGTAQQAVVEMSRASNPPDNARLAGLVPEEGSPDSIRSIAAQRLPSLDPPKIDRQIEQRLDSVSGMNAVDREWADLELATRPPPADAPDEDPIIEVSDAAHVSLDLDDVDAGAFSQEEKTTAQRQKLPSTVDRSEPPKPLAKTPTPAPVTVKAEPSEREMNDRVSVGDYSGALEIAELILADKPNDNAARKCADECRSVLRKMYAARIGPLDRVPVVAVARDQLRWLSIDHKAGFVLSLVDGVSSLEMIIDVSGMPELDTLRILSELAQQRIISLK